MVSYLCHPFKKKGRLAQLVQSTSFTPRGSGVRTPHRPQKKTFKKIKNNFAGLKKITTFATALRDKRRKEDKFIDILD